MSTIESRTPADERVTVYCVFDGCEYGYGESNCQYVVSTAEAAANAVDALKRDGYLGAYFEPFELDELVRRPQGCTRCGTVYERH